MRAVIFPRGLAALGALAASLGLAARVAAQQSAPSVACPKLPAKVTSGHIGVLQWDQAGNPLAPTPLTANPKPATPYVTLSRAALEYGHNRYELTKGTQFSLGCYGQNKNRPHLLWARLGVLTGSATLHTNAATPGALYAWQALINPVGHVAQRISITVKGSPTSGTLTMHSTGPIVDITPEMGLSAGHCIYHHAVVMTSYWSQKLQQPLLHVRVLS